MKLTKRIPPRPARTATQEVRWCKRDFMEVEKHNSCRRKAKMSEAKKCWWCSVPFVAGDMMALIGRPKKINKLICQDCAASLDSTP